MSISGDRTSLPLYTVNSTQASLANGSVSQPSMRFVADSDSGIYWDGNLNLAVNGSTALRLNPLVGANLVGALSVTGNVSCGNLASNAITGTSLTCSAFTLTAGPSAAGNVLTADAAGVGTWQAIPTADTAIMSNVYKQLSGDVDTPLTLAVVDIISTFIQLGSTKSVRSAGWIEFTDSIADTASSYFELPLGTWFSSPGFTITTNKGVVSGGYNGLLRDITYTITTVSGKCRVTFTNESGSSYSAGRVAFNILSIGT